MISYVTPKALQRALSDRAKVAAINGITPYDLVERFYHCRLLARVFYSDSTEWMLKGGQALLVRWPTARHSRDVDLLHVEESIDDAVRALIGATNIDLGDLVRFEHLDTRAEFQGRDIRKVRFTVYLGVKKVGVVSADVVTNLRPYGQPLTQQLEPPFPIEIPGTWPLVRMWPLEDHVADKVQLYMSCTTVRLPAAIVILSTSR